MVDPRAANQKMDNTIDLTLTVSADRVCRKQTMKLFSKSEV